MGISLFFHSLLWPVILLISSLNSLYCPFCPLPVKFSLDFSLPGLSQCHHSAVSSGVLRGRGCCWLQCWHRSCVQDAPGLPRIYGEGRVEQYLWLVEIIISRATFFFCSIHRRVYLLFTGLVSQLSYGFGNCAVSCSPHAQLSSHPPRCLHTLYVQDMGVVNGGDRGGTGSSFPSFWLLSQSYKSPWQTMGAMSCHPSAHWLIPASSACTWISLLRAKLLPKQNSWSRIKNLEGFETQRFLNCPSYQTVVNTVLFIKALV